MSSDWKTYTLGELGPIKTGKTPPSSLGAGFGGTVPFVTPGDMNGQKWISDTDRYLNERGLSAVGSSLMPARSVAVSCIGSDMGKAALLTRPSVTNQQINTIAVDESRFNAEFVYYDLSVRQQELKAAASGSATPILNKGHFSGFEISVPPRATQNKIAEILGGLDDKIDLNRCINQTLEAMAQTIFKSWFVDFDPVKAKIAAIQESRDPLRAAMSAISGKPDAGLDALPSEQYEQLAATAALFPDEMEESELGEIPKGWSHRALAQLTDKIGSGSTPRGGKEVYLEEGVALIRSQNVYDSLFVWEGLARISDEAATQLKGVTVQEDDVLLNITGASILRTCVVEPDALPARVNQHVAIIRAKAGIPPRFIHMHLLRPDIKSYLLGLNAGASREAITKAHIESLTLLTPSPELLAAFQAVTAPLFSQVQNFAQQMRMLSELRSTLLPKLLSGDLSVEVLAEQAGIA